MRIKTLEEIKMRSIKDSYVEGWTEVSARAYETAMFFMMSALLVVLPVIWIGSYVWLQFKGKKK